MTSQDEILKNPSLLSTISNLNGNNAGEFFRVLEETAVLGQWSKPQLIAIGKLKLEGRARCFYYASLAGQELDYKTWKEKFLKQFEDGQSFSTNFSRFSSAFQMESERVRDFASRIEGLAHKSFNGSDVGASGMSEELREKMLLSQFTAGLKPTVRAQILIENPGKFQEAVEVADRIEKAQNMLTPNINVVSSLTGKELGECDLVQHQIHLTDNIPTRQRPYRVPYALKPEMRRQINILLEAGIIQPSNSPYAAPVLLVRKPDGSFRLVADLRKLNEKTIPDNFPLPNLTEMVDMLSGAKFFTSMDLTSGFHQMKMHPDHAFLTGIATEFGVFEFKSLPFGLRNASANFQRLMRIVLAGLSHLQIGCYIDDIIIASKSVEDHLSKLEIVFKRLIDANLRVKTSKCSFLQKKVTYLGHTVSEGQVFPDTKNLDSIRKADPPKNRKQVRSFLGLTGVYRRFIPNYSKTALPLTNLTKKNVPFNWSIIEQAAFETLKNALTLEPCLKLPDFSKPFSLCTDASKFAVGAVLVQDDESGFLHPVAFASRKLSKLEISYSVVEKETLGVAFGVTQFKSYLYGRKFIVYSDQQCLSIVKSFKDPTSRISRWLLTLQEYAFDIIHKPGR
ncbi:Retrovirus-related Pol polyprotein from transposon 17.6 [Araneus ventricosus]|uniref:RNA-directed DNA polymerase n=1 Tax=Araneus ventricosus TaxID=182803 RepID=A0A4Y2KDF0_ARAVE|nr:Retrovirus-related Pol polyprotein from transposon 17.6 [Araneus ventricosus]